ncbi:MAG TPA: hypothetical protein PKH58_07525 [Paludibacteraceae bacterium]|nr:hypothetical protein [Paludibacteraceae bacterium]HPT43610.1 hypothetical protein [Paludibacteraceae bacterium]
MKKIKLLIVCVSILIAGFAQGQVAVNVNIGTPPAWGPAGYSDVRYYYLPDMEVYYDVQRSNFIYLHDNRWVYRTSLPVQYKNYNLYRGYKVPLQNYSGNYPFFFFKQHKVKYAKGYKGNPQKNIGSKSNKQVNKFIKSQHGKSNGNMKMNKQHGNNGNKGYKGNKGNKGNGKNK